MSKAVFSSVIPLVKLQGLRELRVVVVVLVLLLDLLCGAVPPLPSDIFFALLNNFCRNRKNMNFCFGELPGTPDISGVP